MFINMWAGLHVFKQGKSGPWSCAEGCVTKALRAPWSYPPWRHPPDVSPTERVALLPEFSGGRCVRAVLSPGSQGGGDFVPEGTYRDYLRIFEGKLPPFAAFALGEIRLIKGLSLNSQTTCP